MVSKTCKTFYLLVFVLSLTTILFSTSCARYTKADKAIERISPEDARQLVESGQALLVCSYGDDNCKSKLIQGALLKSELEARLASLSKDTQIIFYCGGPNERTSASLAVKYSEKGFSNVMALKGGIDAWKAKGYPMKSQGMPVHKSFLNTVCRQSQHQRAQFVNVIESVFSGMARAVIHNSVYKSVEDCVAAINRHFKERNQKFKEIPKRLSGGLFHMCQHMPKEIAPINHIPQAMGFCELSGSWHL